MEDKSRIIVGRLIHGCFLHAFATLNPLMRIGTERFGSKLRLINGLTIRSHKRQRSFKYENEIHEMGKLKSLMISLDAVKRQGKAIAEWIVFICIPHTHQSS